MAAPHLNHSGLGGPGVGDPQDIRDAKRKLRQAARLLIRRHEPRAPQNTAALIAKLLCHAPPRAGERIAGVWPLVGEPDLRPLWHALHGQGWPILLPETTPPGEALRFRPWHPGCPMLTGRFATRHPDTPVAAAATPSLLFVPLLAFDRRGFRLGHGGGYYDRTLAALPGARGIGYGFSFQQVEAVPCGPFDRRLELIITERGPAAAER